MTQKNKKSEPKVKLDCSLNYHILTADRPTIQKNNNKEFILLRNISGIKPFSSYDTKYLKSNY